MKSTDYLTEKNSSIRRLTKEEQLVCYIESIQQIISEYQEALFIAEEKLNKIRKDNNLKMQQKEISDIKVYIKKDCEE